MALSVTLLGVIFALLATILFNLSPIIQKDAVRTMGEISLTNVGHSVRAMLKNRIWLLGTFIGILGGIPYMFAVLYVGITVVEPLNNAGFLVLVAAAVFYLHEKLHLKDYIAILMLILLPVFLIFARVTPPLNDITQPQIQQYLLLWTAIIVALSGFSVHIARRHPLCWALTTGLIISLATVYAQCSLSLVVFGGYALPQDFDIIFENLFTDPNLRLALLTVIISIIFNALLIYTSQIGLQKNPASKFGPLAQTVDNFFTVAIGILVFGQFVGNWIMYSVGFGTGVIGAIILSSLKRPETLLKQPISK